MADFIADKDFVPDQPSGQANPGFIPDAEFVADDSGAPRPGSVESLEKYGDMAGQAKAAGLGAARTLSFGFSDEFLTGSGLMKPEDIKGYRDENPYSSVAGGVASFFTPTGPLSAGVKAVSGVGGAVTKALLPAVAASSTAGKVLSQAAAVGAGSAIEGIAYGLGESVTEHALGDADLNAEKVLSNVGSAMLVGGAVGSLFGAAKGAVQTKFPKFISPENQAAIESGDLSKVIEHSDLPAAEKKEWFKGFAKRKANESEIKDAGASFGLTPSEGQLSDDRFVKNSYSLLLNGAPTIAAERQQAMATHNYGVASDAAKNVLGDGANMSRAELGDAVKKGIASKFEKQYEPVKQLYKELEPFQEAISITKGSTKSLNRTFMDVIKDENLIKGTPEYNFVETMAEGIGQVDNLARLKSFRTSLRRATSKETKFVAEILDEKLEELGTRAIKNFADNEIKIPEVQSVIKDLIIKGEQAKSGYKSLIGGMQEFGDVLGQKKIYGPQHFLNHIEDMTAEKFVRKVWDNKDSRFQKLMADKFPEEYQLIKASRMSDLRDEASKKGFFDAKQLLQDVFDPKKLTKEERNLLFGKDQQDLFKRAKTWIDSYPPNFNPSNTNNAETYRKFFGSPKGMITGNITDSALEKFVNNASKLDPESGSKLGSLALIERAARKTSSLVKSGAAFIFSEKAIGAASKGAIFLNSQERRDEHENIQPKISELNSDPQKMMDHLTANTDALNQVAPKTSQAVQATMIRATQFLNTKLPQGGIQKPLSPKYKPSSAELYKFHKYMSAVEKPTDALHDVAAGTLGVETMETLSVVYPKLLQEMQVAVTDKMTDAIAKKKVIPYRTKLALSMFLGSDLVNSLDPKNMLSVQNTLATATQAKNQMDQMASAGAKSSDKLKSSNRMLTPMQKSNERQEA